MEKTRPLMMVVIGLGILVVLATTVVIVKVVKDIVTGSSHSAASASTDSVTLTTSMLSQPAGSHIVTIAGVDGRLSVLINGGGPDRILFVDPSTGHVTGQLMMGK